VNIGTPHSPGIGNGTGMPNEDLLPIPEYVGYYFTLYTNENSPFDLTICLDHTAMQYIPFNLAYWNNEVWNFVPDEEMQILWTNPGTTNSCISFTIIPEGRTSIPIVFSGEAIQGEGLPVVITNFEAVNHQDDYVIVNWTTLFETEMSYYRVHRDGIEVHQSEALNQGSEHTYTFTDTPDFTGILSYTLEAVANDGTNGFWGLVEVVFGTGVSEVIESLESSRLDKNYPNPFNPTTTISFSVKENETGILTIFNAKGQVVTNETFYSGTHSYNWNAGKFSSGIYFYKLLTESFSEVKKMMLIK
jgi:hypothetical protein